MDPAEEAPHSIYESSPLARSEYISALVHLYRGEMYRANAWRIRLDNTTNWSVLTVAGLLSFTFGEGKPSHWVLLMGAFLITVFWSLESRRFRFADVWRSRVRKIEENFYGPILRRDPISPIEHWGELVAEDLFQPRFKMTRMQAMRSRLVRNYFAIYGVLFLSWGLHVLRNPEPATSWSEIRAHLTEGLLPWWLPLLVVGGFLSVFAYLVCCVPRPAHGKDEWRLLGEKPIDQRNLDL